MKGTRVMTDDRNDLTSSFLPVTRITGRADIEVLFAPQGEVAGARFRALDFRGFERIVTGMPAFRVPQVVSRVCGRCGPFHQMASSMSIEDACRCSVPRGAITFRRLLAWLWLAADNLLTMVYHALPDYALPMSDAAVRNITGIYMVEQDAVSRLTSTHEAFKKSLDLLAGLPIHPSVVVPGGVASLPGSGEIERVGELLQGCQDDLRETLRMVEMMVKRNSQMMDAGTRIDCSSVAVTSGGYPALIGEHVSVLSPDGKDTSLLETEEFYRSIRTSKLDWSYVIPAAVENIESVLVGPIARVNLGYGPEDGWAELECGRCKEQWGPVLDRETLSFLALALEVVWAWEKSMEILGDASFVEDEPLGSINLSEARTGVAVVGSSQGPVVHGVELDSDGVVARYQIVSPLQFNYYTLNDCLDKAAGKIVTEPEVSDAVSQRLQLVARAFNPCIPCGTH